MAKKLFKVMSCALALVFAACSSPSTPGEAAKAYAEDLYGGNTEAVYENIDYGTEATAEEIEQTKQMLTEMWNEKGKPQIDAKGGVTDIEVLSEENSHAGTSAAGKMKITYGNGESEEDETKLVLVDGKWLLSMDK